MPRSKLKTLAAFQFLYPVLLSRVSDSLFIVELHAFLDHQPLARRSQMELAVWRQALRLGCIPNV